MWIKTLRESEWKYDTGAGGGAGLELLLASGGVMVFDPPSGQPEQFAYAGGEVVVEHLSRNGLS